MPSATTRRLARRILTAYHEGALDSASVAVRSLSKAGLVWLLVEGQFTAEGRFLLFNPEAQRLFSRWLLATLDA